MGSVKSGVLVVCLAASVLLSVLSFVLYTRVNFLERMYEAKSSDYEELSFKYEELMFSHRELEENCRKLNSSYETLKAGYETLNSSYYDLLFRFESLSSENLMVKSKLESLNESYRVLYEDYVRLQEDHTNLVSLYSDLTESYGELNSSYHGLMEDYLLLLDEYNGLKDAYNMIQAELRGAGGGFHSYMEAYLRLVEEVNVHVLHPRTEDKLLVTPDDPRVRRITLQITGGWSIPGDFDEMLKDVKAMYDWVRSNIRYRDDGMYPVLPGDPRLPVIYVAEMWQYPNQTLSVREGDCEDQALLLASMISSYFKGRFRVECIAVTEHMAVYIPAEDGRIMILDPTGNYYTRGDDGKLGFRDARVEVYDWLSHVSSYIGKPAVVEWVFSDELLKLFYNTEAFIDWIYETT